MQHFLAVVWRFSTTLADDLERSFYIHAVDSLLGLQVVPSEPIELEVVRPSSSHAIAPVSVSVGSQVLPTAIVDRYASFPSAVRQRA